MSNGLLLAGILGGGQSIDTFKPGGGVTAAKAYKTSVLADVQTSNESFREQQEGWIHSERRKPSLKYMREPQDTDGVLRVQYDVDTSVETTMRDQTAERGGVVI